MDDAETLRSMSYEQRSMALGAARLAVTVAVGSIARVTGLHLSDAGAAEIANSAAEVLAEHLDDVAASHG
ncbi:lysophospholipase L1-like esterase [Rhodococcus sp. 27YEA15]|uniref:hypothetical protein n=1 Tax=Rhodococcus sp. 27YEA15 TaxID=3156259 RepID=UPI003C7CDE7C